MTCPFCDHQMEQWSEPSMDGVTMSYLLCPHCGCEIGIPEGER